MAQLARIVASINTASRIGVCDRAVVLLGYAAAVRPSESAALHLGDISAGRDGLLVTIRRLQDRPRGARPGCRCRRGSTSHHRPDPRPPGLARSSPHRPLFTRVPATRPITREGIGPRTVSDLVRNRATADGLDNLGVSGHSLRAGHATTAAVNGASIDRILAQTRPRDLTTRYNDYIRPADALHTTTSRDLGL